MSKQLLFRVTRKDLQIDTFRSGGKGGQHQNKTDSGVRIRHKPSGAIGESRSERSQLHNKRLALKRLSESHKFRLWANRIAMEMITGKTVEDRVEEQMANDNIVVEGVSPGGEWIKLQE